MISRIFEAHAIVFLVVFAVAALATGLIVGLMKNEGAGALKRGAEAAGLAFAGGLLARAFISVLIGLAHDSRGAGLAMGWAFFFWPGVVDTIASLAGTRLLTTPGNLLWIATGVGAFAGMMDGIWRIHDWKGLGWLSFPLDVTWGLAGTTNGCLLHLVNFAWGGHAAEIRHAAHRYQSGFCLKPGFALTQGSVMSNLPDPPGSGLFRHERTHVWQNRAFGPIFSLTYIGWMVVWFIPSLVAAGVKKANVGAGIENYCYYNNPWETWAYLVGAGPRAGRGPLIWSDLAVLLWALPFFTGVVVLFLLVVAAYWF